MRAAQAQKISFEDGEWHFGGSLPNETVSTALRQSQLSEFLEQGYSHFLQLHSNVAPLRPPDYKKFGTNKSVYLVFSSSDREAFVFEPELNGAIVSNYFEVNRLLPMLTGKDFSEQTTISDGELIPSKIGAFLTIRCENTSLAKSYVIRRIIEFRRNQAANDNFTLSEISPHGHNNIGSTITISVLDAKSNYFNTQGGDWSIESSDFAKLCNYLENCDAFLLCSERDDGQVTDVFVICENRIDFVELLHSRVLEDKTKHSTPVSGAKGKSGKSKQQGAAPAVDAASALEQTPNITPIFKASLSRESAGQAFKIARVESGLSVRKAATFLGVSRSEISRIEGGQASIDQSLKLMQQLGFTLDTSLTRTPN